MTVKKKGITLIELVVSMAILSIVLSVISSFFFTNYNALNSVNKDLELQSQGEKAINFMVDNIIEGYGVVEVEGIDGMDVASTSESEITKLSVKKDTYISVFELRNGVLYYGKGALNATDPEIDTYGKANEKICNSIKSIKIIPLPTNKNFNSCSGLRIKINLQLDKIEKEFINEVYMRNKD